MFYELNEAELKTIEEIGNITEVDYELKANYIPVDSFIYMVKDMLVEYHKLQEKLEQYENIQAEEPDLHDKWWDRQKGI